MPQPPRFPAPLDDADFDHAQATQRRARRKALYWLFGGFALLFALLAWGFVADEPPPDTSDLRVEFKHPPEDQNAYALLTKLVDQLPDNLKWTGYSGSDHCDRIFSPYPEHRVAWSQEVVAAELSRHPPDLIDQVRAALAAPESEASERKTYDDLGQETYRFRNLAQALTWHAAFAWHSGDHAGAADLNLLVLRLGQRVAQSRGGLMAVLTGRDMQRKAMESIHLHTDDRTVSAEALRRYLVEIGKHEIEIGDYYTAYKIEQAVFEKTACDLKNHPQLIRDSRDRMLGTPPSPMIDWLQTIPGIHQPNRTIRWKAEFLRAHIANLESSPPGMRDPATARVEAIRLEAWPRRIQNLTGRNLFSYVLPPWEIRNTTTSAHRIRANLRLTQIYVALRLYQLEHDNTLPANLAELVPAYLPAVPLDPFGGQPLRYDRALTTIWSIDQDHRTITDADGKLPERGMPAYRLLFARPPIELPAYVEEPEPTFGYPPEPPPTSVKSAE